MKKLIGPVLFAIALPVAAFLYSGVSAGPGAAVPAMYVAAADAATPAKSNIKKAVVAKATAGGRFVFKVFGPGGATVQFGCSEVQEAKALAQQLIVWGVRGENPYSTAAFWWTGQYWELVDVQDPNGQKGEAKAIVAWAVQNAVVVE